MHVRHLSLLYSPCVLRPITFTAKDLDGLAALDARLQTVPTCDPWVEEFYINSYRDVFDEIAACAPAIALPYNCGTVLATANGLLIGIDIALIENYYDGKDWDVPDWLYHLIATRLDMLIVTHGHWDHCWVELIWRMVMMGKAVIVPNGIRPCAPKMLPWGCWGVRQGTEFHWNGLHFAFRMSHHAYDEGIEPTVLTTRIWDGRNSFLHTSDADVTNEEGFHWYNKRPTDVLLFKCGGLSPLVGEYDEMERTIDRIGPRKLILPMHLNELGHRGTDAGQTYSLAYDLLKRYQAAGKLGDRKYSVLFGSRFIRL